MDPTTKKLQEVVQSYEVSRYCLSLSISSERMDEPNQHTANNKGKKQGPKGQAKPPDSQSLSSKYSTEIMDLMAPVSGITESGKVGTFCSNGVCSMEYGETSSSVKGVESMQSLGCHVATIALVATTGFEALTTLTCTFPCLLILCFELQTPAKCPFMPHRWIYTDAVFFYCHSNSISRS